MGLISEDFAPPPAVAPKETKPHLFPKWVERASKDMFSGVLGGIACVYSSHPLDTVKVKMQTSPQAFNKGVLHCFISTLKKEKITGLYAGATPAVLANVAENGALFLFYAQMQQMILTATRNPDDMERKLTPLQNAVAGGLASIFSSIFINPFEIIKVRLQAEASVSPAARVTSPVAAARSIIKTDGVKGLWRGLSSTFAREIPGSFAMFGAYELARVLLTPPGQSVDHLSPARLMISGALGGVAFWLVVFPADVIKSRIQAQGRESDGRFISVLKHTIKVEGIQGVYRGLTPAVVRAFPANAALFLTYELCKRWLGD
eukprot:Colp12_sorted_trinity150504_noHs@23600